jgi:hypothetical protein
MTVQTEPFDLASGTALRHMVDSAFPLPKDPMMTPDGFPITVLLVYAGGDTPHPWTKAEILNNPYQYVVPTWVRSDPGQVNPELDAALFAAWLKAMEVPVGSHVILDLETAVDHTYVVTFNLAMRALGYKLIKYGSQGFIWENPPTDGGTFTAEPGSDALLTEGDEVMRQYAFLGGDDLSILKGQADLQLWDIKTPPKPPAPANQPVDVAGTARYTNVSITWQAGKTPPSIGYMVYLEDSSGNVLVKRALGPNARAYNFGHLQKNTEYRLGVLAKPESSGEHPQFITVKTK